MEMRGCLRCTVGMTGVSSPHLPVAATEIRKPSNVLCYTHLNGSCIDEPWVAACGLGCILCVCGCGASGGEQGESLCAERMSIVLFSCWVEIRVHRRACSFFFFFLCRGDKKIRKVFLYLYVSLLRVLEEVLFFFYSLIIIVLEVLYIKQTHYRLWGLYSW